MMRKSPHICKKKKSSESGCLLPNSIVVNLEEKLQLKVKILNIIETHEYLYKELYTLYRDKKKMRKKNIAKRLVRLTL